MGSLDVSWILAPVRTGWIVCPSCSTPPSIRINANPSSVAERNAEAGRRGLPVQYVLHPMDHWVCRCHRLSLHGGGTWEWRRLYGTDSDHLPMLRVRDGKVRAWTIRRLPSGRTSQRKLGSLSQGRLEGIVREELDTIMAEAVLGT